MTRTYSEEFLENAKHVEEQSEFVVSWHAKKYNKTIFRIGTLNKEGCRVWEDTGGNKYNVFLGQL